MGVHLHGPADRDGEGMPSPYGGTESVGPGREWGTICTVLRTVKGGSVTLPYGGGERYRRAITPPDPSGHPPHG